MKIIDQNKINAEAWKFYIAIPLWILYFISLPYVFDLSKPFFFIYVFTIGNFLFCWLGYLFHETWHEYIPVVPNKTLYYIYGLLLFSDPQIYRITHGSHHAKAHTYEDLEFYPIGELKNPFLKRLYRWGEFLFGVAFLFFFHSLILPTKKDLKLRFSAGKHIKALIHISVLYGLIILSAMTIFKPELTSLVAAYLIGIWIHSFFLHQSQMIEHGFLILEGSVHERNLATRNVIPEGPLEKFFLFLTHDDPREHVFHHTQPMAYLRPFPETLPLPAGSNKVTLRKYISLMIRGLNGEDLKE